MNDTIKEYVKSVIEDMKIQEADFKANYGIVVMEQDVKDEVMVYLSLYELMPSESTITELKLDLFEDPKTTFLPYQCRYEIFETNEI